MSHPSSIEGSETTEALQPVPNAHVCSFISCAINSADSMAIDENANATHGSRIELDSHANMVVVGNGAVILNRSGRSTQVSPFTPDYEALTEVPIVDTAVLYQCPQFRESANWHTQTPLVVRVKFSLSHRVEIN